MTTSKTACYTKSVQPAMTTGHITILLLTSLRMFSEKFTDDDRHRHLYLYTRGSGGRVWEWGRLHYVPQGLLDKRCTSPRDQLAVVCTCQHNETLHICMFPNCTQSCIMASGQRNTYVIKINSN